MMMIPSPSRLNINVGTQSGLGGSDAGCAGAAARPLVFDRDFDCGTSERLAIRAAGRYVPRGPLCGAPASDSDEAAEGCFRLPVVTDDESPPPPVWSSGRLPPRLDRYLRLGISHVLRNRPFHIRRKGIAGREYLDIGCGPNTTADVIGLDFQWRPGVDICWDVTRGIPLADDSLKGVFTEHCIEHVPLRGGVEMLRDCYRVLRPGGTVRVVTPDAGLYAQEYTRIAAGGDGSMPRAGREGFLGIITPMMSVNRVFNQFGHRFVYDFETMAAYLTHIGFVDVRRAEFGVGRDPALLRDTEWRRAGSLYVEASKPSAPPSA